MKRWNNYIFALLGLSYLNISQADLQLNKVNYYDHIRNQSTFELVFDKSVVTADQLNKEADEEFLTWNPYLNVKAVWTAPNVLRCTVQDEVPFRSNYTCQISEGMQYSDKTAITEKPITLHGQRNAYLQTRVLDNRFNTYSLYPWDKFIVGSNNIKEGEKKLIENTLIIAQKFEEDKKTLSPDTHTVAYTIRPLTLAEAQKNGGYYLRTLLNTQKYKAKSKDTPVDEYYVITPQTPLKHGYTYKLVIPNATYNNDTYKPDIRTLGSIATLNANTPDYESVDNKSGKLKIGLSLPIELNNLRQFLKENLIISNENGTFVYNETQNTYTGKADDNTTITIRPDEEKLQKHQAIFGDIKNIAQILEFNINGNQALVTKLKLQFKNIRACDGQTAAELIREQKIIPESPSMYVDAGNNGIMTSGSRHITTNTTQIDKLTIRGYKIREGHRRQTLNAYKKIYEGRTDLLPATATDRNQPIFLPTEMLVADENATLELPVTDRVTNIPLDKVFKKKVEPGMYFIEIEGAVNEANIRSYKKFGIINGNDIEYFNQNDASYATQSLVQVTDIGLLKKQSGHHHFFYTYSLSSGKAINNAEIQILDKTGSLIKTIKTENGTALVDQAKNAYYALIKTKNDRYLCQLGEQDYEGQVRTWSFSDIENPDYTFKELGFSADELVENKLFIFSDRNLYRPGETIHFKGILRTLCNNKLALSPEKKIILTLSDPNDNDVYTDEVTISELGTFDKTYQLPKENVGTYTLTAKLAQKLKYPAPFSEKNPPNEWWWNDYKRMQTEFAHNVKVQEFKRNEFELKQEITTPKVGATEITGHITATNFTGIPVSNGKVEWGMSIHNTNFYPKNYQDYRFGMHIESDSDYWSHYYGTSKRYKIDTYDTQKSKLDDNGEHQATFNLKGQPFPQVREIQLFTYVTNNNEQQLSTNDTVTWYPSSVFVGVKNKATFCRQGEPLDLRLVAVNIDGTAHAEKDITLGVEVIRKSFSPIRFSGIDGSTIRNQEEKELISQQALTITPADSANKVSGGKELLIPTTKDGIYEVTLKGLDPQGRSIATAVKYYVYGSNVSPWEYHDGLKVDIIPNKQLYRSDETAKILVQTPIEGDVIVTVEREKVLRQFTCTVSPTNPVIEIPLKAEDAPNVYVSVFQVRGADLSKRKAQNPQLKLGYVNLNIQPLEKTLKVSLDTPKKEIQPGESCTITGTITDHTGKAVANAEVCLFAEDEGTLQVIGYNTPNPLKAFYSKRPLWTNTWTMLHQILTEDLDDRSYDNKGMFIGGGDDVDSGEFYQKLKTRSDFNPCAVWLASIKTDANGHFSVSYKNPDTLTRYRVMAVALTKDSQFGSTDGAYIVNKPIMLEPAPPISAVEGDTLIIPVTISQTKNHGVNWQLKLHATNGTEVTDATQTITLQDKLQKTIYHTVKFNQAGEVQFRWEIANLNTTPQAGEAQLTDSVTHKVQVSPPTPELREWQAFTLKAGESIELNKLIKTEFRDDAQLSLKIGNSPILYANSDIQYLFTYPYGCVEQKSSMLLPWLYMPILHEHFNGITQEQLDKRSDTISKAITEILSHQLTNGGFCYWKGGNEASDYTAYAALVLTLAKEQGAKIPSSREEKLHSYLQKIVCTDKKTNCLAAWVLARHGKLTLPTLNRMLERTETMSEQNKLYLALAIQQQRQNIPNAQKLIADLTAQKEATGLNDKITEQLLALYSQHTSDTAMALSKYFMNNFTTHKGRSLLTTQCTGWNMILLGEFLRLHKIRGQEGKVLYNEQNAEIQQIIPAKGYASHCVNLSEKTKLTNLNADSVLYVALEAKGRAKSKSDSRISNGFQIHRTYEKLDGDTWEPATEFEVGDWVRVTLRATATSPESTHQYIVIEDYLPSTMEAVNPELDSQLPPVKNTVSLIDAPSYTSHKEILKDRIRFFINAWYGNQSFQAQYTARVTKAGQITAPAAKIECMYEPSNYGLSIPQELEVTED